MSFWSKLGKGALKVAPIAAGFIPGVGPLASMAIGAGTSALSNRLEGGDWKKNLTAGAIGGATGYASGKLGEMAKTKFGYGGKGKIGPSQEALNSPWANPGDASSTSATGLGVLAKGAKTGLGKKVALSALGAAPLLGLLGSGKGKSGAGTGTGTGYGGGGPIEFGNFNYRNPDLNFAIRRGQQMARGIGPSTFVDPQSYGAQRNPYTGY